MKNENFNESIIKRYNWTAMTVSEYTYNTCYAHTNAHNACMYELVDKQDFVLTNQRTPTHVERSELKFKI